MFEKIQYYYQTGYWTVEQVRNVVGKTITTEEFKQITGQDYN